MSFNFYLCFLYLILGWRGQVCLPSWFFLVITSKLIERFCLILPHFMQIRFCLFSEIFVLIQTMVCGLKSPICIRQKSSKCYFQSFKTLNLGLIHSNTKKLRFTKKNLSILKQKRVLILIFDSTLAKSF